MRQLDPATQNFGASNLLGCAVVDVDNGYAYFGTMTTPGRVLKVAFGDGTTPPSLVGSLTLGGGEGMLSHAMIDTVHGYAYFVVLTDPIRIVKVALGSGGAPPTRVGVVSLAAGESHILDGFIDTQGGYGWLPCISNGAGVLGGIVKIALGSGTNAPVRLGRLELPAEEASLYCGAADAAMQYGYFGTYKYAYDLGATGRVVKVDLGSGTNLPTRVGAVEIGSGHSRLTTVAVDSPAGYAYVCSSLFPSVAKVALGSGSSAPTHVATTALLSLEGRQRSMTIDAHAGTAVFSSAGGVGTAVKVALGSGSAPPSRLGALDPGYIPGALVVDTNSGTGYFAGDWGNPMSRVALSHKSVVGGSKLTMPEGGTLADVRFYSHAAAGNVRLAIYGSGGATNLLWQSGVVSNTVTGGWVTAAVGSGSPTALELSAADYWLAWQVDTTRAVASYVAASLGEGFYLPRAWGAFPASLTGHTMTDEAWARPRGVQAGPWREESRSAPTRWNSSTSRTG